MYPIKNLRRRGARTTFLVIGVALAITLTTIMYSISEGINTSTKEIINETNIELFVYPKSSNPILQEFTKYLDLNSGRELAAKIRDGNPAVRAASPWLVEGIYITTDVVDEDKVREAEGELVIPDVFSVTGKGYVPELQGDFGAVSQVGGTEMPTGSDPFYANGTYADGLLSENFTHELVLNEHLAKLIEVSVGDTVYISGLGLSLELSQGGYDAWLANATWFKIYGIVIEEYEPASILTAGMHLSELQYLTGKHRSNLFGVERTDFINEIYVDLYDPDDSDSVKRWLLEDFEDKDRITVLTAEELTSEFSSFLDVFKGFSDMIVIITSFVVVLFVSTIMMISVQEQGREIGMLRAIGISKGTIIKYILIESIVICLIGLGIGVVLGYAGAGVLEEIILSTEDELPVGVKLTTITPGLVLQVSLITIVIGVMAGLIPAIWASRVMPVEAIRKV